MANRHRQSAVPVFLLSFLASVALTSISTRPAAADVAASFGMNYQGSIDAAAEVDAYTVSAQAGDVLVARMVRSSGSLWPQIRLFAPSGTEVPSVTGVSATGSNTANFRATVSATGTYTFRLDDGFNDTLTGGYGFFVQRANNPGGATAFEAGKTMLGSIDATAEMDTYTLPLQAGDVLFARMSHASGDLWPLIRVYTPSGSPVVEEYGAVSKDTTVTVSSDGNYTVMVGDGFRGSYTGAYGLFVQRLNRPANATPLVFPQVQFGAIENAGEMKTYTASLPAGTIDTLGVRMRATYGNLWPLIRIYSAEGLLVAEDYDPKTADASATGAPPRTYTILVGDGFNGTFIGGYRLMSTYTVPDLVRALRIAGGLDRTGAEDPARLNVSAGAALNLLDAVQMLRLNEKM